MSVFASVHDRMVRAGMIDGATGCLTPAGMAYTDRLIAALKAASPPPDGVRPHPGARLPEVRWNTKRSAKS